MKTLNWIARFSAAIGFAASGTCIADVGLIDGQETFATFQSNKTRAEVQQEYMDARAQGLLPRSNFEYWTSNKSSRDIGPRGPAGSRYQMRTREEVMQELRDYRRTHKPNAPDDLYFG